VTPLIQAANSGQRNIVEYLLQAGADPDLYVFRGFTPLIVAVVADRLDCARLLIQNSASLSSDKPDTFIAAMSPVIEVIKKRNEEMINLLMKSQLSEIDLNIPIDVATPLITSLWQMRFEVTHALTLLRVLLPCGSRTSVAATLRVLSPRLMVPTSTLVETYKYYSETDKYYSRTEGISR
jgi:hypothetical protein